MQMKLTLSQTKAELLEKYRAKQKEALEVQEKLQRLLSGIGPQSSDDCPSATLASDQGNANTDGEATTVFIDKRLEQRLQDKLTRHHKNMADLRRKLVEEDKRERARRRKVRAKREAMNRGHFPLILSPTGKLPPTMLVVQSALSSDLADAGPGRLEEELYMEDWESILTAGPDEAEQYLEQYIPSEH